jgi:isomaltose glucohydrolase
MSHDERTRLDWLARHSVQVILANQAPSGAYLASPSFPVYRFSWFRDGAFIAEAMSRAGHRESADRFFGWCSNVLTEREAEVEALIRRRRAGEAIEESDFLHARYTVDGKDSGEDWWTFQLDGYGSWLWALDQHARRHDGAVEPFAQAAGVAVRYLAEFWFEPCYDWWEEHRGERHTSTLAAIRAGLVAAAGWDALAPPLRALAQQTAARIWQVVTERGIRDGRLTKWLDGGDLDASLIACATPFLLVDPRGPVAAATIESLEAQLAHGGVHRYGGDVYYGGGEWVLLAGMLGSHYAAVGRIDDAWAQLRWIAAQATDGGDLPEQVSGHMLHPDRHAEWVERWGPVATPLLWSHAMFVTLALDLDAVVAPFDATGAATHR